ncbi:serine/threonine-protein kinase [Paenibacillus filicis]|uniref:non-specific serine/threonine protein kinase n=1 Tax=Paenibacillus gyeongsangnamensis TaxID=3388067 RepID=A0ABT4QE47_9BACL|nr:serine/threonine-protein kinase [Paenibacillus filicis]MCZ8515142.1 serine/threonine-protein kinase [Paenibacillus filicis]
MNERNRGMEPGQVLAGRYRLIRSLGCGGMSRVFLAEDLKLPGKLWAVKEAYAGLQEGDRGIGEASRQLEILRREAETMSRLRHPNLPDIVDYVQAGAAGRMYLVMDYIEGETLQERFDRLGKRVTEAQAAEWGLQLCELLDYLHGLRPNPVIHRDLKPSNLMIDAGGSLRLIDFGTARTWKEGQPGDTVYVGTVGFAAPEQFSGGQSDPRTDLYGLGALLYYLLCGGERYDPAQPSAVRLPEGIGPIVLRLLERSPDDRYPSARAVSTAIRGLSRSGGLEGIREEAAGAMPCLIAVAALYRGAGATFTALALSRALQDRAVPHAVLEPPTPSAELYALLFADKHAPPGYNCYTAAEGDLCASWIDGETLWLPASPGWRAEEAGGCTEASYWKRLFRQVSRPVVVADIGADWEQPAVRPLLEQADAIVCTMDPHVHKLELPAVKRRSRQLQEWRAVGKRVFGVANKSIRSKRAADWLRLLPLNPICELPALDAAWMAEASWRGELAQDIPAVRRALGKALEPWIVSLLEDRGLCADVGPAEWKGRRRSLH